MTEQDSKQRLKDQANKQLYMELADLTNPRTNGKMELWYLQEFERLGFVRVMELASLARQNGRIPHKYFSKLIVNERQHVKEQ